MEDCAGLGSVSMAFGSITAVNCVHASELDKDLATILSDTFALVSDDMRSQRWLHLNLPPSLIDLDALGFPCWSISGIHWHEMDGILSSLRPHHGLPWLSFFKNGNARVLLGGIKQKYGDALSWGDLMTGRRISCGTMICVEVKIKM